MAKSTTSLQLSALLSHIPLLMLSSPTTVPLHLVSAALDTDALHLTLGCQGPMAPTLLNNGEFPSCAAMTTGYVFRVENEATVFFLQSIGTTGALTHLKVCHIKGAQSSVVVDYVLVGLALVSVYYAMVGPLGTRQSSSLPLWPPLTLLLSRLMFSSAGRTPITTALFSTIVNTVIIVLICDDMQERMSKAFQISLLCLFISRLMFAYVLCQRSKPVWHGATEPGVKGSLLVLLSRDRWVRLDGDVDDLKAVTSGSWLQPATVWQESLGQASCLLVWLSVIFALSAETAEKTLLVLMVLVRHVVTGYYTRRTRLVRDGMTMHERRFEVDEDKGDQGVVKYGRRLEMAEELIKEFARRDWAGQMGMVKPEEGQGNSEVIM